MADLEFEQVVKAHYAALYRFALSLTRSESDACDLTQETFYLWATRSHQLRDGARCKSWLFTTLYRAFLKVRRRAIRFPHEELGSVEPELPSVTVDAIERIDADMLMQMVQHVDEVYRTALMLFYVEDHSYNEIAMILDVPPGTVMSRIARGKEQLRSLLAVSPKPALTKSVLTSNTLVRSHE